MPEEKIELLFCDIEEIFKEKEEEKRQEKAQKEYEAFKKSIDHEGIANVCRIFHNKIIPILKEHKVTPIYAYAGLTAIFLKELEVGGLENDGFIELAKDISKWLFQINKS